MTQEPKEKTGVVRDKQGRYVKGHSGNQEGMPPFSEEQKIQKKATKEYIKEYKEKLGEALPKLSPVLIDKAEQGDLGAIKEINDRVMGKAPLAVDVTSKGEQIYNWGNYGAEEAKNKEEL